jgi:hypothetical protein
MKGCLDGAAQALTVWGCGWLMLRRGTVQPGPGLVWLLDHDPVTVSWFQRLRPGPLQQLHVWRLHLPQPIPGQEVNFKLPTNRHKPRTGYAPTNWLC